MPRYHLVSKLKYSDKGLVIECLEEKGIERKGKDDIYSPLSILCTMVLFVCLSIYKYKDVIFGSSVLPVWEEETA